MYDIQRAIARSIHPVFTPSRYGTPAPSGVGRGQRLSVFLRFRQTRLELFPETSRVPCSDTINPRDYRSRGPIPPTLSPFPSALLRARAACTVPGHSEVPARAFLIELVPAADGTDAGGTTAP